MPGGRRLEDTFKTLKSLDELWFGQRDDADQDQVKSSYPKSEDNRAEILNEIDRLIVQVLEGERPRFSWSKTQIKEFMKSEKVEGDDLNHDVKGLHGVCRDLNIGQWQMGQDLKRQDLTKHQLNGVL